jgi:protein-L-isoaspartate(D-aspartate) O-methyltransferase
MRGDAGVGMRRDGGAADAGISAADESHEAHVGSKSRLAGPRADAHIARVTAFRQERDALARAIDAKLGPFDSLHLEAIRAVPRERFVRTGDEPRSAEDTPLPLDDEGLATISAPHAYLLSLRLLELAPGDRLVELGSGSGYGAALARFVVGPLGRVLTFEIDADLARRAAESLAGSPEVVVAHLDAMASAGSWRDARKVVCTFAVSELPRAWLAALPEGGVLVAPVGDAESQELVRARRERGSVVVTRHGGVRYVPNRSRTVYLP